MALTTVNITGTLSLPDGTWPDYAQVHFQLSDYEIDGDVVVPYVVKSDLSAAGELDADIWGNDDGTRGTNYQVYIAIFSDAAYSRYLARIDMGEIEITGDGPFDIADLLS